MCLCVYKLEMFFDGSAQRGRSCVFACFFEDSVVVLVMLLCQNAPVKTQHFVPQTNMSLHESQNNTHTQILHNMQMWLHTQHRF